MLILFGLSFKVLIYLNQFNKQFHFNINNKFHLNNFKKAANIINFSKLTVILLFLNKYWILQQ